MLGLNCLIWIVLSFLQILEYICVRFVSLIVILGLIVLFVFRQNIKIFLYVAYGQYSNIFWTFLLKKNIQSLKENVF
jgi:hypothetical protein